MAIDWNVLFVAGISAIFGGGTIAALIQFWSSRKKVQAEADNLVVEGARALLEPLTKRVTALESQSAEKDKRIEDLEQALKHKDEEIASLRRELDVALQAAKEATQARAGRIERIAELEKANALMKAEIAELQAKIQKIEKKTGPLDPGKAGENG